MGWTEVGQYSKVVKCPLENQYFASYIAIAAIYFERICIVLTLCFHILLTNHYSRRVQSARTSSSRKLVNGKEVFNDSSTFER